MDRGLKGEQAIRGKKFTGKIFAFSAYFRHWLQWIGCGERRQGKCLRLLRKWVMDLHRSFSQKFTVKKITPAEESNPLLSSAGRKEKLDHFSSELAVPPTWEQQPALASCCCDEWFFWLYSQHWLCGVMVRCPLSGPKGCRIDPWSRKTFFFRFFPFFFRAF